MSTTSRDHPVGALWRLTARARLGESIFRKQTAGMPSATLFAAISTMKIALSFKLGTLHAILRELAKKNQLSGDELLRRLFP